MTNVKPYPIATICGSMRFFDSNKGSMLIVAEELTRRGYLVLMPFVYKATMARDATITPEELDAMHRVKIAMADIVVIVTNRDYYMGESTMAELEFAKTSGKLAWFARTERRSYANIVTWYPTLTWNDIYSSRPSTGPPYYPHRKPVVTQEDQQ